MSDFSYLVFDKENVFLYIKDRNEVLMKKLLCLVFLLSGCSSLEVDKAQEFDKRMTKLEKKVDEQKTETSLLNGKIEELSLSATEDRRRIREENKITQDLVEKRLVELETFTKVQEIVNQKITQAINDNRILVVETKQNFENFRAERIDVNTAYYIKTANDLYKQQKYKKAHEIFSYYLKNPHLLNEEEYRVVFYRTALMEYRMKKYDDALVHFSQLYRNFHKKGDKYIASSLYHVGVILLMDNKCADAKYVFDQVVNEYGSHKYFSSLASSKLSHIKNSAKCRQLN